MVNVVSAGAVPEYSVVRYYRLTSHVGYLLRGSGDSMMLVDPLGTSFTIHVDELVELLATPAATACFYIGNKEDT